MKTFFKAVNKNHYQYNKEINTKYYNYGVSVGEISDEDAHIYDEIFKVSSEKGISLGDCILHAVKNNFFKDEWSSRKDAQFREYLYERVRKEVAPTAPVRCQSIFACTDGDSVIRFCDLYKRANVVYCNLHCINSTACFQADMCLIDKVEKELIFDDAVKYVEQYWRHEQSSSPLFEIILQGNFNLGEIYR